ncbi:MAG: SfnB family sulfur acquisition oxidoreductase [Comamonas sp.]
MSQNNAPVAARLLPTPAPPLPASPAYVIRDDAEAIEVATALAPVFADGAAERDRARQLPLDKVDAYSQSGLWGITIPRAYGGAGVSHATLAKVFATLAAADASLTQLAQNSFEIIEVIRNTGSEVQKQELFGKVLAGYRLGNAFSEYGGKNVESFETRVVQREDGQYAVNGRKFYSTGALFAHLVPIVAIDEQGRVIVAVADRDASGLSVLDDWSAFGQRTTASGTVVLEDVSVAAARVLPAYQVYDVPSAVGPQSQIIHAAIDAGIGRGALQATLDFVRTKTRPWIDSGLEKATDDPFSIATIGDLHVRQHAAEALLERAGLQLDVTVAQPTIENIARAKIAVAEAKLLTTEIAISAANKLFELAGTRSTLLEHGLDRIWRDARVHTLHDPVRWKPYVIGRYYLSGVHPPLHSWI